MKMNHLANCVLAVATTGVLSACGGGTGGQPPEMTPPPEHGGGDGASGEGTAGTPPVDRETIYRTSTVSELVALGARRLTEDEFRSEIVGERLRNTGDVDDGTQEPGEGWIWKINSDGTSLSYSGKGRSDWEAESIWTFENGQYCRNRVGDTDAPACSKVYELNGVYRFTSSGEPDALSGWSVEVGGWDAGQLLYDGETLNARNLSAMRLAHQEGQAELIEPVDFSIRRTEDGNYVVTLDGFEHTFTPDQRTAAGAEGPSDALNIDFSVYGSTRQNFNENLDNGHSGGSHVTIWGGRRDQEEIQGQNPQLRTFATFGNPTTDFSRLNDMTATYSGGWAWIDGFVSSFDAGNFDWDDDRIRLWSDDMAFKANFSNATISGRIQDFKVWDSDEPYDLTLTMPETSFGTEAFQGSFDVTGETLDQATASYDASFWGPDANQFAGTMSISGTDVEDGDTTPFVGIGHFVVNQDQ